MQRRYGTRVGKNFDKWVRRRQRRSSSRTDGRRTNAKQTATRTLLSSSLLPAALLPLKSLPLLPPSFLGIVSPLGEKRKHSRPATHHWRRLWQITTSAGAAKAASQGDSAGSWAESWTYFGRIFSNGHLIVRLVCTQEIGICAGVMTKTQSKPWLECFNRIGILFPRFVCWLFGRTVGPFFWAITPTLFSSFLSAPRLFPVMTWVRT